MQIGREQQNQMPYSNREIRGAFAKGTVNKNVVTVEDEGWYSIPGLEIYHHKAGGRRGGNSCQNLETGW